MTVVLIGVAIFAAIEAVTAIPTRDDLIAFALAMMSALAIFVVIVINAG